MDAAPLPADRNAPADVDAAEPGWPPSAEHQGVLHATAQAVERARALQGTLRRVADAYPTAEERAVGLVEGALEELDAVAAAAWQTTDDGGTLEAVGTTSLAAALLAGCERIPAAADCPVSEAVRTDAVVSCGTRGEILARYPALRPVVEHLGLQAIAAVPARHMGRVHGVLAVGWTSPRRLASGEQVMLRTTAGRVARALAHARLYYAERAAHAAAERARAAEAEARREAERARADADVSRRAAEDANRAKDDFLAVVSHELRTPMQAILGFSDLLGTEIAGPLAPRQHDYVRRIQAAGGHLLDTIENLLGFARAQAGKEVVDATAFDAAAVVAQVLDIAAPLAARKEIALAQAGATAGVAVVSDERKVRQIVTNLVGNAVKFTACGRVTAEVAVVRDSAADERVRFVVRDTGIGIPDGQLGRVFEPFVQVAGGPGAQTTTRTGGGTGLGLSIVRELARLLGGEVRVTSVVGEGSEFVVELPRVFRERP